MPPKLDLALGLIQFVVLLLALTIHESSHAWSANRLGDPTAKSLGRISLNPLVHIDLLGTVIFPLLGIFWNLPLIGWAKPVPVDLRRLANPRRDWMLIAGAGPTSNVLQALGFTVIWQLLRPLAKAATAPGVLEPMLLLCFAGISINVALAVFNLIPVPPLDGNGVLQGILPEPLARALESLRPHGLLILYALMLSGAIRALYRFIVRPVTELLVGGL